MADDVFIIGLGMMKFGKYLERSIKSLTGEALTLVLDDAGLSADDLEAAWFSNSSWGMSAFQHCIRGQVALSANGLEGIPVTNVENACAGASTALHGAWTAVKAGLYDCALAIGVEKLNDPDRSKVMMGFITGTDVEVTMEMIAKFQKEEQDRREREARARGVELPKEKAGGHSAFMDLYAMGARTHMKEHGTTQRQIACIAAKNHNNSVLNPLAQYTFPMTVDEVMADREVAYPLTRAMCAPIGDGAAAAIVCSERFLKKAGKGRAVRIRASVLQSGNRVRANDITARTARKAFDAAGIGPGDVSVVEVHDATAYGELFQTEQIGFCEVGEGGPFAERGETALTGKIPVNPSGGLIARGHPVGASGLAQIHELGTQLRGEAGKRQVQSARIALAENGGGFLGQGEAAMVIHILEKV